MQMYKIRLDCTTQSECQQMEGTVNHWFQKIYHWFWFNTVESLTASYVLYDLFALYTYIQSTIYYISTGCPGAFFFFAGVKKPAMAMIQSSPSWYSPPIASVALEMTIPPPISSILCSLQLLKCSHCVPLTQL